MLGLFCSCIIWLWVQDEISFNRFFNNAENIYFVHTNTVYEGKTYTNSITPGPLYEAILSDVPEVEYATKLSWENQFLLGNGERVFKEKGIYATDDFFNIFQFPTLEGNPIQALKSTQMVITSTVAKKLFPNKSALNETVKLNNDKEYVIGAVIDEVPVNSTVRFDWIVNIREIEQDWMQHWGNNSFSTYVSVTPGSNKDLVEDKMKDIYNLHSDVEDTYPVLQSLTDVYLYASFENGVPTGGRIQYVKIFMLVALFILMIACINYINLSTVQSFSRSKEVGLRKVIGASKKEIVKQFLSETALFSIVALLITLLLVDISLPVINNLVGKQMDLNFGDPNILIGTLVIFILTGILAGSYPAFFVSSFKPISILNNRLKNKPGLANLRKILVTFQFTLSIFFIIGIIVVSRQMNYTHRKDLGLERSDVIYIPFEDELKQESDPLMREIALSPNIVSATTSNILPIDIQSTTTNFNLPGNNLETISQFSILRVGYDFLKTFDIDLVAGRDFSEAFPSDSKGYLINESAAKILGMANPVGAKVKSVNGEGQIIGVIKDFHLRSLHVPITPLVLCLGPQFTQQYLLVKAQNGRTKELIGDLSRITQQLNPTFPFEYYFLDDEYNRLYQNETVIYYLINFFGLLAVTISCLGLLGLVSFTAEKRFKEIGIRKVLGATISNIISLLSRDFFMLIFMAIVISSPIAWYVMNSWLQGFAYKVEIQWWMFAVAGILTFLIATLTIGYQSLKAAAANPVDSIKLE